MFFSTFSWIEYIVLVISALCSFVYLYLSSKYKYWQKRKVPYKKPHFLFGNFKDRFLGRKSIFDVHKTIYDEFREERFAGFYEMHAPSLMIIDPELIHRVLVKDFAHFYDRGGFPVDKKNDPLTLNLFSVTGDYWHDMRRKMSSTFSSGKLKAMTDQIHNCGERFIRDLDKYAVSGEAFEGKDVMDLFTVDVIASCAFGLQINVNTPEGVPFKKMIRKALPESKLAVAIIVLRVVYTKLSNLLGMTSFPRDVTNYFLNLTNDTVQYREQNGIKRKDFLQLMLEMRQNSRQEKESGVDADLANKAKITELVETSTFDKKDFEVTNEVLAASSFAFLLAGAEVSTVLGNALYCLAQSPHVQQRLQEEVDRVTAKHGRCDYEALKEMTYMDQVLQETIRLFATPGQVVRVCTTPYHVPGTDLVLERGTRVTIPVWALHRDPRHYPNPLVFEPERFSGNNYKSSPTYLPFGDGPRMCIAMRFSILEMKLCLALVMRRYSVHPHHRTLEPLTLDPKAFLSRPLGGVWFTISSRSCPNID